MPVGSAPVVRLAGIGRATGGGCGRGVAGRSIGGAGRYAGVCSRSATAGRSIGAGRYRCVCSIGAARGTGAATGVAGWTGTGVGSGGRTLQRSDLRQLNRRLGRRRGRGDRRQLSHRLEWWQGPLRRGCGASGAKSGSARSCASGDGGAGWLEWLGSRSTMARRPATAASAGVDSSSSRSPLNGSAGNARRGVVGSENPR